MRSAAIQAGRPAAATTTISLGPAWKSIAQSRDDQRLCRRDIGVARARRSCRRAESSRVPKASAAIACAPPTRNSRETPATSSAAHRTVGSACGQTAMTSRDARRRVPGWRSSAATTGADSGRPARSSRRGRAAARAARFARPAAGCDHPAARDLSRGDAADVIAPRSRWPSRTAGRNRRARRGGSPPLDTSIGSTSWSNCRAYASSAVSPSRRTSSTIRPPGARAAALRRLARSSSDATAASSLDGIVRTMKSLLIDATVTSRSCSTGIRRCPVRAPLSASGSGPAPCVPR